MLAKNLNISVSLLDHDKIHKKVHPDNQGDYIESYHHWLKSLPTTTCPLNSGKIVKMLDSAQKNNFSYLHALYLLSLEIEHLGCLLRLQDKKSTFILDSSRILFSIGAFSHYLSPKENALHNIFLIVLQHFFSQINDMIDRSNNMPLDRFLIEPGVKMELNPLTPHNNAFFKPNVVEPSLRRGGAEYLLKNQHIDGERYLSRVDRSISFELKTLLEVADIYKPNLPFIQGVFKTAIDFQENPLSNLEFKL